MPMIRDCCDAGLAGQFEWCTCDEDTCDNCGKPDLECECVMCGSCLETVDADGYNHDWDCCQTCVQNHQPWHEA